MQGFASIVMSPAVQMNRAISPQHGSASSDLLEAVFPPPAPAAACRHIGPAGVGSCSDCIPAFSFQCKTWQQAARMAAELCLEK